VAGVSWPATVGAPERDDHALASPKDRARREPLMPDDNRARTPLVRVGKYRLLGRIAAGGMAEVFLARAEGPAGFSKLAVVKRVLPHMAEDEEFIQMFLNEAKLVAQLNHPNVIQIFELGQEQGTYFIAMEFIDGPSLRKLAKVARAKREHLPIAPVLRMVSLACEGLGYAHAFADERGVPLKLIHRDISPDNLLLSRQGSVKVADFGIAKAATLPSLTRTGAVRGKLSYMAPEQLRGDVIDHRIDVFALGVVLHELVAGAKPFDTSSEVSTMRSIIEDAPRRIAELRPDAPPGLQPILDRALAKDRDQRYPDCRAFQADLEALLMALGAPVRALDLAALVEGYFPPGQPTAVQPAPVDDRPATQAPEAALDADALSIEVGVEPPSPAGQKFAPETGVGNWTEVVPPPVFELAQSARVLTPEPPPRTRVDVTEVNPTGRPAVRRQSQSPTLAIAGAAVLVGGALVFWQARARHDAAPEAAHVAPPTPQPEPPPAAAPAAPPAAAATSAPTPSPAPKPRAHRGVRERPAERAKPPDPADLPWPTAPAADSAPAPARAPIVIPRSAPAPTRNTPRDAAPSAAPGKLLVQVQPWAAVEVDGSAYGVTPIPAIALVPGTHQLRLTNGPLHIDRVMQVEITSAQQKRVKINLAE